MRCPVCDDELTAVFVKGQRTTRQAVMLTCPRDSRHCRVFINDPVWVGQALAAGDPKALLTAGGKEA